MVFTRRLWALVALGIPIAGLSAALGSPSIAIFYDLLILLAAWASTRLAPPAACLRVTRRFDPVLSVRAENRIEIQVENDGLEAMDLILRDEPPPSFVASQKEFKVHLEPGDRRSLTYTLRPLERGDDSFRGTEVRVACPFGLALSQSHLNTEQPVRVYPNVLALKEFALLRQQGRLREIGIRKARMRGLGTEFESLRNYTEGDDYRKIDWKATARRGDVMVRQYEQERNQSIMLCIDIGRHMLSEVDGVRKLDHVLDSILMLTNAATMAGDLVGLIVYADEVRRFIPPRKGRSHLALIIEACHDLIAEPVESDLVAAMAYLSQKWKRRSLVVCFTDCEDANRAADLLNGFLPIAKRHIALLCRVLDPRMKEVQQSQVTDLKSFYAKAAASILLEDRKHALATITAVGVHVLDSEPQELATNLVNYYFTMKEKSLL